jgi:hypothetical protein
MTAVTAERRARLNIGKVFTDTIWVLRRKWLPFGAAILIVSTPGAINTAMQAGKLKDVIGHPGVMPTPGFGNPVATAAIFIFGLIAGSIVIGGIFHGTVRELDGEPVDFMASCRVALRNGLGLVAAMILWALGVALAGMLLFVPGVMLAVAWAVVLPAKVTEGIGPLRAFGRSADLTRGKRWSIFLLGLIVAIVVWIAETVFVIAAGIAGGLSGFIYGAGLMVAILTLIIDIVCLILGGALYQQLRLLHDGPQSKALGEIFA